MSYNLFIAIIIEHACTLLGHISFLSVYYVYLILYSVLCMHSLHVLACVQSWSRYNMGMSANNCLYIYKNHC